MAEKRPSQGQNQQQGREKNLEQNPRHNPEQKGTNQDVSKKSARANQARERMGEGREQQLRALRDRLYSRTEPVHAPERHALSGAVAAPKSAFPGGKTNGNINDKQGRPRIDETVEPPRQPARPPQSPARDTMRDILHTDTPPTPVAPSMAPASTPQKIVLKGYRVKIIAVAVVFFVVALALSSSFLFFGQNTISGDNIAIDVVAPFAIGGGEELSLDIAVTNKNAVTVESATLIIEYPPGTQDANDSGKELFRQRIPLGSIRPGEVLNTPVKARIFGEENEDKPIHIFVEYRVEGSNATFFREAKPFSLKISSSPIVLVIEGNKEVSSGQEVTLTLTLASNASAPLTDLLVQVDYPFGFDFSEANPKTVKGQNLWGISSLAPGAKEQITLKGVMTGGSEEARTFKFSVGVPSERDRFTLASVLTTAATEIRLTDPFVGLKVTTNGSTDKTISVSQDDSVTVAITFENTLPDTIYDGTIRAALTGNGLNASNISASSGFFDSSTATITWDKSQVSGLGELAPGEKESVNFTIRGANLDVERTPQVSYKVSVSGRRVSETRVPQELTNIESRTIRFESIASLSSHGLYSIGPFTNTGPIPPRAETMTQYAVMLKAGNGSNELADATVTMTLPSYVTWSDVVSAGDDITYNTTTREATWKIGTLDTNASTDAAFQVSFLPSVSQVGTVPALVGEQRLKATDRFTGTVVRATSQAITTHLPEDPNSAAQVGRVEPK